jgi:hypothetical protein
MTITISDAVSETRCFCTLNCGQADGSGGEEFHAVASFMLGAVKSLIGCLDYLLGLAVAGAGLSHSYADRDGKMIRLQNLAARFAGPFGFAQGRLAAAFVGTLRFRLSRSSSAIGC